MYCCLSREPHFLCSMLNETLDFDSDDEKRLTGTETRPKEMVAVPIARAGIRRLGALRGRPRPSAAAKTLVHDERTRKMEPMRPCDQRPRVNVCDPTTRQIAFPTSSATSNPPRESNATPTGRPRALPSASRNPMRRSTGIPEGFPLVNGTKTTL